MIAPSSSFTPPPSPSAAAEPAALALSARAFRQAALDGRVPPLLKGRKLGVLCGLPAEAEALVVHRAARELGAHVSLVAPGFDEASGTSELIHTARTLGRLYDVVACLALSPVLVRQLRAAAGIPVLDDASVAAAPPASPAPDGAAAAGDEDRCYLWQAALVACLA
jgi:ornithine carbamoyltransferase